MPLGLAFAFAYLLVTQPLGNAVSRRYEAEADWLALEATRDPESGIALDRNFVRTGLADPDPPGWVAFWYATHPTPDAADRDGRGLARPPLLGARTRCPPARGGS